MNITKREEQHIEECLDDIQEFTEYIENISDKYILADCDSDFLKGMSEAFEYMIGLTTETNIRDLIEARCESTMQNLDSCDIDFSSSKSVLEDRLIRAKRYAKALETKIEKTIHLVAPDNDDVSEEIVEKERVMDDLLVKFTTPMEVK
tara:strand:- start:179 stop:622 length:444 start_codon:yes stop_codon:yes gene_type:complete